MWFVVERRRRACDAPEWAAFKASSLDAAKRAVRMHVPYGPADEVGVYAIDADGKYVHVLSGLAVGKTLRWTRTERRTS